MAYSIHDGCTGCTACARQCPVAAISGDPEQTHQIDAERCTDCGVCGLVCPEPFTVADGRGVFATHIPRSQRPRPVFDPETCNGCGSCVDICPFGSLSLDGPVFRGTAVLSAPESCVSCGYCEDICIKRAVWLEVPTEDASAISKVMTARRRGVTGS
jgi:ferredoxin